MITMKVEGHPELRRIGSGAIINIDANAYEQALARRNAEKEKEALKEKVNVLECKINRILALLEAEHGTK